MMKGSAYYQAQWKKAEALYYSAKLREKNSEEQMRLAACPPGSIERVFDALFGLPYRSADDEVRSALRGCAVIIVNAHPDPVLRGMLTAYAEMAFQNVAPISAGRKPPKLFPEEKAA